MDPNAWLQWLRQLDPLLGYVILGLASIFEYVFPPFPGDTVTLAGAVMIAAADWSLPAVLIATSVGSMFGAWLDFAVGRWLHSTTTRQTWLHRWMRSDKVKPSIDRVLERFTRYGPIFIVANRFLPAVRGVFFVAAGMAGLRTSTVLIYALLSALAWNSLIIGVGYLVGFNLDTLVHLFQQYTTAVWIALAVIALVWLARKLHAWRTARTAAPQPAEEPPRDA